MALYEYNLFLVREASMGPILPALTVDTILKPVGADSGYLFGRIACDFEESTESSYPPMPVEVVSLYLQDSDVNSMLREAPDQFIDGLWTIAEHTQIAYAFIGAASDAAYFQVGRITSAEVFRQVGRLVASGEVEFVHPAMFFAERLGRGRTCEIAQNAPRYTVTHRPGIGCLLLLMSRLKSGGIAIEDPGIIYPELIEYFRRATALGIAEA